MIITRHRHGKRCSSREVARGPISSTGFSFLSIAGPPLTAGVRLTAERESTAEEVPVSYEVTLQTLEEVTKVRDHLNEFIARHQAQSPTKKG